MKQARIGAVLKQVQTVLKHVGLRYVKNDIGLNCRQNLLWPEIDQRFMI